jgi:hypothetical protein
MEIKSFLSVEIINFFSLFTPFWKFLSQLILNISPPQDINEKSEEFKLQYLIPLYPIFCLSILNCLLRSQDPITFIELVRFVQGEGLLIHSIYTRIENPSSELKTAYFHYSILSLIIQSILDQQFEEEIKIVSDDKHIILGRVDYSSSERYINSIFDHLLNNRQSSISDHICEIFISYHLVNII